MFRRSLAKLRLEPRYATDKIGNITHKIEFERDINNIQNKAQHLSANKLVDPNTYAPTLVASLDYEDAKANMRAFYRKIIRMMPKLLVAYNMPEMCPREVADSIKSQFQRDEINDASLMDMYRYRAEVDFTDIVRMHFTQSHIRTYLHRQSGKYISDFPELPPSALPNNTSKTIVDIASTEDDFLKTFLDPQHAKRIDQLKKIYVPTMV